MIAPSADSAARRGVAQVPVRPALRQRDPGGAGGLLRANVQLREDLLLQLLRGAPFAVHVRDAQALAPEVPGREVRPNPTAFVQFQRSVPITLGHLLSSFYPDTDPVLHPQCHFPALYRRLAGTAARRTIGCKRTPSRAPSARSLWRRMAGAISWRAPAGSASAGSAARCFPETFAHPTTAAPARAPDRRCKPECLRPLTFSHGRIRRQRDGSIPTRPFPGTAAGATRKRRTTRWRERRKSSSATCIITPAPR